MKRLKRHYEKVNLNHKLSKLYNYLILFIKQIKNSAKLKTAYLKQTIVFQYYLDRRCRTLHLMLSS